MEALRQLGHKTQLCPYFLARHFVKEADIILVSQQHMLDPRLKSIISSQLNDDAIIVLDECNNIEGDSMNHMSLYLNRVLVDQASHSLKQLEETIRESKGS